MESNQGKVKSKKIDVFLNYHVNDREDAKKFYNNLKSHFNYIEIWFEEYSYEPGRSRQKLNRRKINEAEFFITLFSSKCDKNDGNFFERVNTAIKNIPKRIDDVIYFIPVKLDDCGIGFDELTEFYTADLYTKDKKEDGLIIYKEGIEKLSHVIAENTTNPKVQRGAVTIWNRKDYEGKNSEDIKKLAKSADQLYVQYLEGSNNPLLILTPEDHFVAGLYSFACDEFIEALKRFSQSLINGLSGEYHPDIYSKIGACYIKIADLDRAEIELNRAIKIDSEYPPPHYNLGILHKRKARKYWANNQKDIAEEMFKNAITNFEKAIILLEKDKSRDYRGIDARNNLATTKKDMYLFTQDKTFLKEAIEMLVKLVKNNPKTDLDDTGLTKYNLACFLSLNRETDASYKYLAASLKEDNSHAIDSKRDTDLHNLKWERASDYKELVKKHFGDYIKDVHLFARDLSEKRDKDGVRSIESIRSAVNMVESSLIDVKIFNAETYHLLAYCYSLIGNEEKKEEYLELYDQQLHNEIR